MINNYATFTPNFISLFLHMSQFIVSARKYRPQLFDEVVGQEHITTTLKNAIRHDKVAHAFLFCGPRGVGKTTTARILAKTINCENITEDIEACGECPSCVAFQKKNAPNILELDAASHNSVDDIRNLNEQVRIPPAQGNYKLFIIDEVHMLSISAFNAFLKTLEEPPPSAIFILATTEKHKILPTILSRCQIYDFKRNKVNDIVPHLEMICRAEELEYDQEALHLIAEKADGALRDALSIFDRMVSFSDGKISYTAVIDQLNVLDYDYFFLLVNHLITGDLAAAYLLFDQILDKGFSPEVFLLGFQEHLRQLLMIHLSDTATLVNGSQELQQRYTDQSNATSRDFLLTILDLANECDVSYRFAQNKRLHVEIVLMKMAYFPYATQHFVSDQHGASTSSNAENQSTETIKKNDNSQSDNLTGNPAPTKEKNPGTEEKRGVNTVKPEIGPLTEESTDRAGSTHAGSAKSFPSEPADSESESRVGDNSSYYSSGKTRQKSKNRLPTLNGVDEIIEEVEQHDTDKHHIRTQDDLLDLVQQAWNEFSKNHSSPSLATYLSDSKLEWKDGKLHITVTSRLAKSSILDQRTLFENIREATAPLVPEIIFDIDSDNGNTAKPPRILTTKEKFESLQKSNPKLDQLIQELNMKIDEH